jgi:hypothetical protein
MPITLLILLSKSITYIKTNNVSPLEPSRITCIITSIIPGLVIVASKHCNLTARVMVAFTCWMLLVSHSQRPYCISFFILTCGIYIICVFPARNSYVGSSDHLIYLCFIRLVYRFWWKAPRFADQRSCCVIPFKHIVNCKYSSYVF